MNQIRYSYLVIALTMSAIVSFVGFFSWRNDLAYAAVLFGGIYGMYLCIRSMRGELPKDRPETGWLVLTGVILSGLLVTRVSMFPLPLAAGMEQGPMQVQLIVRERADWLLSLGNWILILDLLTTIALVTLAERNRLSKERRQSAAAR